MSERTVSQQVLDYVLDLEFGKLPERTVKAQEHSVNDMLACMLAATSLDETAPKAAEYAMRQTGPCTLLFNGAKTSPEMAALANGVLSHAIDFDDSHDALVHPSGVIFPAALAVSEYLGDVSGEEFITALVIGTDLSCRFTQAITVNTQPFGWNHPAITECLGAVYGVAKLMRLDEGEIMDAVAMAMTQFTCSGESLSSKGSVIRTMREGFAAQAVVQSCMMAKLGMHTRFDTPLEGKMGFYTMYTRGNCDLSRITDGLGERFETDNITYKPWPSCKATHTPIQALTDILQKEKLTADDIIGIHLKMHESAAMALEPFEYKLAPESVAMAKVSMPFVLGTILKYGSLDLGSFTEERLADPDIREQGRKISFEYEPSWGKPQAHFADVTVKTSKGEFFRHEESSMGGTGHPLTDAQVRDKFFSCLKFYRMLKNEEQIEKLFSASMNASTLKNVKELIDLL
ncbi:MAG: MmgE/PrpD family protein [Firmicutes bacterium]|nr:MmgE/PrpD family protein [Bacillota bacterium]MBQ3931786.1 MmgE/PrpD family protein [Bacillota bacterium]